MLLVLLGPSQFHLNLASAVTWEVALITIHINKSRVSSPSTSSNQLQPVSMPERAGQHDSPHPSSSFPRMPGAARCLCQQASPCGQLF